MIYCILLSAGIIDIRMMQQKIMTIALLNKANIIDSQALALSAQAKAAQLEEVIRDWQSRTTDRWNKLSRDNENIIVPKVEEPSNKKILTDKDLTR